MIKEFWCIDKKGILLFHYVAGIKKNTFKENDLMSGFFNAMESIINFLFEEEIKTITMEKITLLFYKEKLYTFIAKVDNSNYNEEKTIFHLKTLSNQFYELYGKNQSTFNGEISKFSNFKNFVKKAIT